MIPFRWLHFVLGGKMKKLILLVGAILVGTYSFADIASTGVGKNSLYLKSLSTALKTYPTQPKQDKNDITMVYGGEDISRRPTIVPHTATA